MPESDRARLIEAEWQVSEADTTQTYTTEINIYANNRKGLLAEVSKIFLELDIDIITINVLIRLNHRNSFLSVCQPYPDYK